MMNQAEVVVKIFIFVLLYLLLLVWLLVVVSGEYSRIGNYSTLILFYLYHTFYYTSYFINQD